MWFKLIVISSSFLCPSLPPYSLQSSFLGDSKCRLGYAFVQYTNVFDANRALQMVNGKQIKGKLQKELDIVRKSRKELDIVRESRKELDLSENQRKNLTLSENQGKNLALLSML